MVHASTQEEDTVLFYQQIHNMIEIFHSTQPIRRETKM